MSSERKAISALKWATAAKLVVQVTSWAGTLVVVRLLAPTDYGLMAKVSVVCTIPTAVAELGLAAAIVSAVKLLREDLRKLYGISLLFGAFVTIALAASAPWVSRVFQEPRLTWPIVVASLNIIVAAAAIVPSALWTRDLSFRPLAKNEIVVGFVTVASTLMLAWFGAGVWALVLGNLLGGIARSAGLLLMGERVPPLFSVTGIGEHLKFGLTVAGNRFSYFVVSQSDIIVGSALLSTVEIGQYVVALQLATLPMTKVMGTINQIALPAIARQQEDRSRVRQTLLKSVSLISLAAFPMLWGISAVAPELVAVLFGEKWLPAIPALTILPVVVPIRMIASVMFTASLALGNRQLDLRNTIVNSILLPSGFFIGAHWGLVGLCSAWLISIPLSYSVSIPGVLAFIGVRARDLLSACGAPALAAGIMYAAVAGLRMMLGGQPSIAILLALCSAGALVYFAVIALVSRRHLISARSFARAVLARDVPKAA